MARAGQPTHLFGDTANPGMTERGLSRKPKPAARLSATPRPRARHFVFYEGPACGLLERCHNPTAEQLLETLRRLDESWDTNIGQAWMAWHGDRRAVRLGAPPASWRWTSTLVFHRNSRRGWYFEYADRSLPEMTWLVPFDEARQRGRRIGHFACDWVYLLPGCFVPLESAERIVLDFLRTGRPSPAAQWADGVELRSRIDGYEEDRSMGQVRVVEPDRLAEPTPAPDRGGHAVSRSSRVPRHRGR
jgi:hypothetical protein